MAPRVFGLVLPMPLSWNRQVARAPFEHQARLSRLVFGGCPGVIEGGATVLGWLVLCIFTHAPWRECSPSLPGSACVPRAVSGVPPEIRFPALSTRGASIVSLLRRIKAKPFDPIAGAPV